MNILLINPLIRADQPPNAFPIGLGIIASVMRQEGHQVYVYDENVLRPSAIDMYRALSKIKDVEVVGVGGMITTYASLKRLVPFLRHIFTDAKIVLGGGVTIEPEVVFKHMAVDFCVHGEGENTFRELCVEIGKRKNDFSKVSGISYADKDGDKVITTSPRPVEQDLDCFPMPAYDLFPLDIYLENMVFKIGHGVKRSASLLWSRGCPNQCTFCWRMSGKSLRFRSIDLLMKEIAFLRSKYGVDSYVFFDECINASRKTSIEFATKLIESGFAAPWFSHARVTNFDEELADLFSRSGCKRLNFGIESGSQEILKVMKKNVLPQQATKAVAIAQKANISQVCTFIIGTPGETKTTVKESVRWIRRNRVSYFAFFFNTPYPGCELYFQPLVQERILSRYPAKDSFFSALGEADKLCVNLTDFSDRQLLELKDWAIRKATISLWQQIYLAVVQFFRSLLKKR